MANNEYDFPIGIDYSNLPSPFGGEDGNPRTEGKDLKHGENNLTPYASLSAGSIYSNSDLSDHEGLKRFSIHVSPLNNSTFPNNGNGWAMVNIDSAQLYSDSNGDSSYKYGKAYTEKPYDTGECPYFYKLDGSSEEGPAGAYESPVPMPGLPVRLQKVYFCAESADSISGNSLGSSSSYFSYFACSNPVKNFCFDSGAPMSPRDNNYALQFGSETTWDAINICSSGGGGGGGGGCDYLNICVQSSGSLGSGANGSYPYLTGEEVLTGIADYGTDCWEAHQNPIDFDPPDLGYDEGVAVKLDDKVYLSLKNDNIVTPTDGESSDYWEYCPGIPEDPCTKTLVFSGCYVDVEPIAFTSGGCSGTKGSLITFHQPPRLTSYAYETGSDYVSGIVSGHGSGDCCEPFQIFSGCGVTVEDAGCGSIIKISNKNSLAVFPYETGSGYVSGIVSSQGSGDCCDPFIIFSGCGVTTQDTGCGSIVSITNSSSLSTYSTNLSGTGFDNYVSGVISGQGSGDCCDPFIIFSGCDVTTQNTGCGSIVSIPSAPKNTVYSFKYQTGESGSGIDHWPEIQEIIDDHRSGDCCEPFQIFSGSGVDIYAENTGCGSIITISASIGSGCVQTFSSYSTNLSGTGFDNYVSGVISGQGSGDCCDPFIIFSGCDVTTQNTGCGSIVSIPSAPKNTVYSFKYQTGVDHWPEIQEIIDDHGSGDCCEPFQIFSGSGVDIYAENTGCGSIISIIASGGSGSGCESFSGFHADSGNYQSSGCDSFRFSGCSGIDTKIIDNVLEICYTGCNSGAFTHISSTDSLSTMDTDGSCTGEIVFSGCSGIFVGIEPDSNIVSICYTGSGTASGSGIYVSGQDNCNPNYPTYSASRADGIVFGPGLKVTSSGNSMLVDPCCPGNITGSTGDEGSYEFGKDTNTFCDQLRIFGRSGVHTKWESNELYISHNLTRNFAASGCLSVNTNTSTDTTTYSISKQQILTCLGVYEHSMDFVICDSSYPDGTGCCNLGVLLTHGCETTTPAPTGACCFNIGDPGAVCEITDEDDCTTRGGTYMGDNTACGPNTCFTTTTTTTTTSTTTSTTTTIAPLQSNIGACCLPDGTCTEVDQFSCTSMGGSFIGVGWSCFQVNCPPPTTSGPTTSGPTTSGPTTSGPTTSPTTSGPTSTTTLDPLGACCHDGTCSQQTQYNCEVVLNGTWIGAGMSCEDAACDELEHLQ